MTLSESTLYILDTHGEPQRCPDAVVWGRWFETADRRICDDRDEGDETGRKIRVSTVFLGIDHQWHIGPPVLWETMVFDPSRPTGELDGHQRRYTSREAALLGHQEVCAFVSEQLRKEQAEAPHG